MKKYITTSLIILSITASVFILVFIAGKNILPDLLGTTATDNINSASTQNEKLMDKKAPYLDLFDIAGKRISLSDFTNTPVVIVFWSTWNKESADQIKILDDYLLSNNVQNSLVKVIAVDSMEEASVVKSFIRRGGYNVPVALDTTGDVSNLYNIKSLPTAYFIDKDGIVKEIYTGVLSESMVVDKVENLLK